MRKISECDVCGSWREGSLLPSGNKRSDGTTPCDNFVCNRCQDEARELHTLEKACDRWEERTAAVRFRKSGKQKVEAWQRP